MAATMSATSQSQEYQNFRSTVPQQKIVVESTDEEDKIWTVYDAGPKSVRCPLIFLPPASGTADIYFKQIVALSSLGYRVMSIEYPVYWTTQSWTEGFRKLMDHFMMDKVHIFGASLGGFLAQKFGEYTHKNPRVHSMILCNSFTDTSVFQSTMASNFYWMLPGFALKQMILGNYCKTNIDPDILDSIDFMVERLESIGRAEIASRLTLNCSENYVEPQNLRGVNITILDVFDPSAISDRVKEDLYKCYPNEKRAHLKSGGNFPYLARSAEVTLHIQIHLRQFNYTRYSALHPSYLQPDETEIENAGAVTKSKNPAASDVDEEEEEKSA